MTLREKGPQEGIGKLRLSIERLTGDMRSRDDSFWPRIRTLLRDQGLDPSRLMLVQLHPEGTNVALGIVVTPTRRVFLFLFDYYEKPIEEAHFTEWVELTGQRTHVEYRAFAEQIEGGIALASETPKPN